MDHCHVVASATTERMNKGVAYAQEITLVFAKAHCLMETAISPMIWFPVLSCLFLYVHVLVGRKVHELSVTEKKGCVKVMILAGFTNRDQGDRKGRPYHTWVEPYSLSGHYYLSVSHFWIALYDDAHCVFMTPARYTPNQRG
jgi:hypothetical protein